MNEREELATVVRGLVEKRSDSAAVRAAMASDPRFDIDLWRTLCDQVGVAALAVPEHHDGAGATLDETAAVLTELARALTPSPLLATSFTTVALLVHGNDAARADLLPRLASGDVGALAWPAIAGDLVLDGATADVVLSITDGTLRHHQDVTAVDVPALDPTSRLARVTLDPGTEVGRVTDDTDLTWVCRALITAEQAGCARRGLDMTVAHTLQREQFGRPIGSFQALKHRMADMLVRVEMMLSASLGATDAAAHHLAAPSPDTSAVLATRAAAAASYCTDALADVTAEVIQLHGGIGITWEHDAHLVFKRAMALGALFGPAHLARASLV